MWDDLELCGLDWWAWWRVDGVIGVETVPEIGSGILQRDGMHFDDSAGALLVNVASMLTNVQTCRNSLSLIAYPHNQRGEVILAALHDCTAPVYPRNLRRPDTARVLDVIERPQAHARVRCLALEGALRGPEPLAAGKKLHLVHVLPALVIQQGAHATNTRLGSSPVRIETDGLDCTVLQLISGKRGRTGVEGDVDRQGKCCNELVPHVVIAAKRMECAACLPGKRWSLSAITR